MSFISTQKRSELFWDWFSKNETLLSEMIEHHSEREPLQILTAFDEGIKIIADNLHFNVSADYQVAFSINGSYHLFYILPFVLARMPEIYRSKWTFLPCLPPRSGKISGLSIKNMTLTADDVWVYYEFNDDSKKLACYFASDIFSILNRDEAYDAISLLLDIAIGDRLSYALVEEVIIAAGKKPGMVRLSELYNILKEDFEDLDTIDPASSFSVYEMKNDEDVSVPRDDIILGTYLYGELLSDYYSGSEEVYNELLDCGAHSVFLFYFYNEPIEDALTTRYTLSDRIENEILGPKGSGEEIGIFLGSAVGKYASYIDLILYNREAFFEKSKSLLSSFESLIFISDFYSESGYTPIFGSAEEDLAALIPKLDVLHELDAHEFIEEVITLIPEEQRTYNHISYLARALNNLDREEEALVQLELIAQYGKDDPLWNYRKGFSLLNLGRKREAEQFFLNAIRLGDDSEDTADFLKLCKE
jgi:hypothetical protein